MSTFKIGTKIFNGFSLQDALSKTCIEVMIIHPNWHRLSNFSYTVINTSGQPILCYWLEDSKGNKKYKTK